MGNDHESVSNGLNRLASGFRALIREYREASEAGVDLTAIVARALSQALRDEVDDISQFPAILEQEQLLQKIIDTLPSHVAILNESGEIVLVNKHWDSFGKENNYVPEKSSIGTNYIEVCERAIGANAFEASEAAEGIRAAINGKVEQFVLDYPCHAPNQHRWFRLIATPLVLGEARGATVMHVAITEVVQAKAAVEESEKRHREMFRANPHPMWVYDVESFKILDVNNSAVEKYGYSRDEFLSMTLKDLRPEEDIEKLVASVGKRDEGFSDSGIWRHRTKDGRVIFVEISSHAIDYSGHSARIFTAYDLTGRLQAEKELADRETHLQTILNTMPECVKIIDRDLKFVHMNPAGLKMLEVTSLSEIQGQQATPYIHPDSVAEFNEFHRRALEGESLKLTFRIIAKTGTEKWMESHLAPLRYQGDDVLAVLSVSHDVTERKRIEAEKERSDSLLNAAIQLSGISGWEITIPDMTLHWSEMMREILEVPEGEELGLDDDALYFSENDKKLAHKVIADCIKHGKPFEIEIQLRTVGGRRIWVRSIGSPVFGHDGQVERVRGAFSDITQSKAALEELQASEERFRTFLDGIPTVPIQGFAPDGTVQYWNKAAESLYGYSASEVLGVDIVDLLVLPEDREKYRHEIRAAVEDGVAIADQEMTLQSKDGGIVNVFTSHTLVRREGREPEIFCIDIDLSERKRLEEQLITSEERFRYIAQATVDVAWDWNIETNELWWSEKMTEVFGHRLAELEMDLTSWVSRIHPEDAEEVMASIHAVLDDGQTLWEANYRFKRSDAEFAHVFDRGFVIRDTMGNPIRMVGGMSDITSTLKLEEQLRQSQRLETVGQLTGGIAHDFNNLLTVIMGNAEILSDQLKLDKSLQGYATMIFNAAGRGAELTQRLLSFARRQPLDPVSVNVPELIREMSALMKRTLGENIDFELHDQKSKWVALVDPTQLENAVLNLSLNARDAMPEGGKLTIEVSDVNISGRNDEDAKDMEPGEYVLIAVSDDGLGMTKEQISRAFEPLLYYKAGGQRDRARTEHGLRIRQAVQGAHHDLL